MAFSRCTHSTYSMSVCVWFSNPISISIPQFGDQGTKMSQLSLPAIASRGPTAPQRRLTAKYSIYLDLLDLLDILCYSYQLM